MRASSAALMPIHHLLRRDQLLAGPMAAALRRHLILKMQPAAPGAHEIAAGAGNIECGSPAGIGIDEQRQFLAAVIRRTSSLTSFSEVIPKIRQAEGGVRNARAGKVDAL